jgi:hypothetical protein
LRVARELGKFNFQFNHLGHCSGLSSAACEAELRRRNAADCHAGTLQAPIFVVTSRSPLAHSGVFRRNGV